MLIIALDLGTKTGWAQSSGDGTVWGTLHLKGSRYEGGGMRYVRFRHSLDWLLKGCERVVFEEVRRHLGTDAAHIYGGLLAVLTAECEQRKIPYEGVPVGTIKKHATGSGNAKKDRMLEAARAKWGQSVEDDNQADALWLLDWAVRRGEDYR